VLVTVTACVWLVLAVTFENERLEGASVRTGGAVAAFASPESETTAGVGDASLSREILPVAAPAVFGVKRTLKLAVWLAAMASGRRRPGVAKAAPVTFAAVKFSGVKPVLEMVTVCELMPPITTVPKLTFGDMTLN
jgi:hypothetical protein